MSGWESTEGLADDFDFEVAEAYFGTDPQYNNGETPVFTLRGPASRDGVVFDQNLKMLLTLGNGWTVGQGGTSISHASNPTPNGQTGMGAMIDSLAAVWGDFGSTLTTPPTNAETWKGFKFHVKRGNKSPKNGQPFQDRDGNPRDLPLATAWLGTGGGAVAAAPAPAAAPAAAPAPAPAPAAPAAGELEQALRTWAHSAFGWKDATLDQFVAYSTSQAEGGFPRYAEVQADADLNSRVLNGTIFAEVQAAQAAQG